MTKTLNKYVAFLLIVSFVLSLGSVVSANQINSVAYKYAHSAYISCDSGPNSQYEDDVLYSEMINQQFDALVSHWGGDYPDFYSGSFIKERTFTILVTCKPEEVQDEIWAITGNDQIIIRKVTNSYKELHEAKEQITSEVFNTPNSSAYSHIVAIGVDEIMNDVFIEVYEPSDDILNELHSKFDSVFPVRVVESKDLNKPMSNYVTSGTGSTAKVFKSLTTEYATISFCAARINGSGNTELGFVTTGHLASYGTTMLIVGTAVGKISWRSINGTCDAAFVNMNECPYSGYVRSNILSSNYIIGSSANVGVVGTTYSFHGQSSGISYGTVDNTSIDFTSIGSETYYFTDQIRMHMYTSTVWGDSGGPLVKTASGSIQYVIGILAGGSGYYSYFTKASNILSAMNGWIY